jgi:hypothetical protein
VDVRRVRLVGQQSVGRHLELVDPALLVELHLGVPGTVDTAAGNRVELSQDLMTVPARVVVAVGAGRRREQRQTHQWGAEDKGTGSLRHRVLLRGD